MKPAEKKARRCRRPFKVFRRKPVGGPCVNPEVRVKVAEVRRNTGVSLQDAASRIRRAYTTLWQMENGLVPMSEQEAEVLLAYYGERAAEVVNNLTEAFLP